MIQTVLFFLINQLTDCINSFRALGTPKGYSRRGTKISKCHSSRLHAAWFTSTLLISIDPRDQPITIKFRNQTNNQFDFSNFIAYCIANNVLRWGDTLVMDNARVHHAKHTYPALERSLSKRGIRILFLPTYSPELNPCELVFAQVKRNIRNTWVRNNLAFKFCMFEGFGRVTRQNLINYYKKCRNLENITF